MDKSLINFRVSVPADDQMLGLFAQFIQGLLCKLCLMWAGILNGHSQRKTLAVCHHHKLRALATLGFADLSAPFLAGTKLPSMKHSAHWICPFSSSSRIKARQSFNHTPCSSHILSRLQQVLGQGYFSGRSFHRAPLRKIHKIPSSTRGLLFQGRPLRFSFGNNGSISSHCLSVRYLVRLIGLYPPTSFYRQKYAVTLVKSTYETARYKMRTAPRGKLKSL